jgi:hypothetical protein
MKTRLLHILQLLGLNAVPAWGLFEAGWSPATVLALYWCENLLTVPFVALRIGLHRRWTGKSGHNRPHLGLKVTTRTRVAGREEEVAERPFRSLLAEYVTAAVSFTLVHGLFLALLLGTIFSDRHQAAVDRQELGRGVAGVAVFLALGFLIDLVQLRDRPFFWIRRRAEGAMARVFVIHLAIVLGMAAVVFYDRPVTFFTVFLILKLLVEIGSYVPQWEPDRPPRGLSWILDRIGPAPGVAKKGENFDAYWRRTRAEELARREADERPREGEPAVKKRR